MKYKISAIICAASLLMCNLSVAVGADSFTDKDTVGCDPAREVSSVSDTSPATTSEDESSDFPTINPLGESTPAETDIPSTTPTEITPDDSTPSASTPEDGTPSETTDGESSGGESSGETSPSTTPDETPNETPNETPPEDVPEESVQSIVYKYLTNELGLNSAAAAGIMGNVMIECGFDPSLEVIDTNNKPSFGIMMWNGPRYESLKKWCEENGFDKTDPRGQMGYLKWELENTEKSSYTSMKNVPDTAEGAVLAAILWADEFERCTKTSYGLRVYYALNSYWQDYAGGETGTTEGVYGYYYNVPDNIKVGEPLTLYGAVVSYTSPLKSITAGVYSEDGKLITGRTMSASNHVGNLGVIDRFIVMNKLPKGKYYYTITAKNETDEYVVERHLFTVSDEPTRSSLVYETEGGGLCEMGAHCPSFRFSDMTPITHWAHGDIDFVLDNGFFLGNGAGYFLPETNMSRAMFVTVLNRLSDKYSLIGEAKTPESGETTPESGVSDENDGTDTTPTDSVASDEAEGTPAETTSSETTPAETTPAETTPSSTPPETAELPFDDVIYDSWYGEHVLWAHKYDLVRGKGNGKFDPDGEITRGELAVLMYRAYEKSGFDATARADLSGFADCDSAPDWAREEMAWAVSVGLINGTVKGGSVELSTMELATREQVSAIIRRFATLVENSERLPTTPEATPDVTPAETPTETPVESVADTTADTTPIGTTEE